MKTCQWCDAAFTANVGYQIYCSPECRDLATREKISQRYAVSKRNKMIGKKRYCKYCGGKLSAYNDDSICQTCIINPTDVNRALKEIKGIADGKTKLTD